MRIIFFSLFGFLFFFFFFSSRRRHTRCSRDWSSDVCSSDLVDGEIHDVAVRVARVEGVEAAPADDAATVLGDDHRMPRAARLQPVSPLLRRAQLGLEGGEPVLDALVVDLADRRRVSLGGRPDPGRGHGSDYNSRRVPERTVLPRNLADDLAGARA